MAINIGGLEDALLLGTQNTSSLATISEVAMVREIPAQQRTTFDGMLYTEAYGLVRDTLIAITNDPMHPEIRIPMDYVAKDYFVLTDNEYASNYEESGDWRFSSAQAYGLSSRFVFISPNNADAQVQYRFTPAYNGYYMLSYIVPAAENSALRARYRVTVGDREILHQYLVNQNAEGDLWRYLGRIQANQGEEVIVTLDLPDTDQPGRVLRADAMQLEFMGRSLEEVTVDNDSEFYSEEGNWATSVATAFGTSSRYAFWSAQDAKAIYRIEEVRAGLSQLSVLLPETENASTAALYRVFQDGKEIGRATINQNEGSGSWVPVGAFLSTSEEPIEVHLSNAEESNSNRVLRADAIRWTYPTDKTLSDVEEDLPVTFELHPNYPNPFNPQTTLVAQLPEAGEIRLEVFDLQGRRVAVLADGRFNEGIHRFQFNAANLSSGLYIARLQGSGGVRTQKMMLVK